MIAARLGPSSLLCTILAAAGACGSPQAPGPIGPDGTGGPPPPPPCREHVPAPLAIPADGAPEIVLTLADTPTPGTAIEASFDPQSPTRLVTLAGTGLETSVDRFDDREALQDPRVRLVLITPLVFSITATAPGVATLDATVTTSPEPLALRWTIPVASPTAGMCPPPPPTDVAVEVSAERLGAPLVRVSYARPPRVGVHDRLDLIISASTDVNARPGAPFSMSYMTALLPAGTADLGIPPGEMHGSRSSVRPRWIGNGQIAFSLPLFPTRPGPHTVDATLKPYYCSAESCLVGQVHTLRFTIPVRAAAFAP